MWYNPMFSWEVDNYCPKAIMLGLLVFIRSIGCKLSWSSLNITLNLSSQKQTKSNTVHAYICTSKCSFLTSKYNLNWFVFRRNAHLELRYCTELTVLSVSCVLPPPWLWWVESCRSVTSMTHYCSDSGVIAYEVLRLLSVISGTRPNVPPRAVVGC